MDEPTSVNLLEPIEDRGQDIHLLTFFEGLAAVEYALQVLSALVAHDYVGCIVFLCD